MLSALKKSIPTVIVPALIGALVSGLITPVANHLSAAKLQLANTQFQSMKSNFEYREFNHPQGYLYRELNGLMEAAVLMPPEVLIAYKNNVDDICINKITDKCAEQMAFMFNAYREALGTEAVPHQVMQSFVGAMRNTAERINNSN